MLDAVRSPVTGLSAVSARYGETKQLNAAFAVNKMASPPSPALRGGSALLLTRDTRLHQSHESDGCLPPIREVLPPPVCTLKWGRWKGRLSSPITERLRGRLHQLEPSACGLRFVVESHVAKGVVDSRFDGRLERPINFQRRKGGRMRLDRQPLPGDRATRRIHHSLQAVAGVLSRRKDAPELEGVRREIYEDFGGSVYTEGSNQDLRGNLIQLGKWAKQWQMQFNSAKFQVSRFGSTQQGWTFTV
ncbi:uncharacterized protein LOC132390339 [Hypanus sabinus]|uniref:uncharacterized protein LOC132390339 n=1 Tax=Hypanus sabinus TaxID=79690 RepID=UPI0028C4D9A7|nr:uncharacterized protein LOC132390339 [Hypanus sabinus]